MHRFHPLGSKIFLPAASEQLLQDPKHRGQEVFLPPNLAAGRNEKRSEKPQQLGLWLAISVHFSAGVWGFLFIFHRAFSCFSIVSSMRNRPKHPNLCRPTKLPAGRAERFAPVRRKVPASVWRKKTKEKVGSRGLIPRFQIVSFFPAKNAFQTSQTLNNSQQILIL